MKSPAFRSWCGMLLICLLPQLARPVGAADSPANAARPNVVIVVADDMGWRDTGYQGSPHAKTPQLDAMAATGLRFDYFYAGQQMCSPGRFAILTGRTPFRTGLQALGAMRPQEITLAQALKSIGYRTGHFGKWHLGSSETSPEKMGFDQAIWKLNYYDLGAQLQVGDSREMVSLEGDTSVATMQLALDFIRRQVSEHQPFFVQVCFGSPHSPHQAAAQFKALYQDLPEKQREFLGELSGIDAAVGNLRQELKSLGVEQNTLFWFTSDNGGITADSQDPSGKGKMNIGSRTVSVIEWPARIKQPIRTSSTCGHVDIYPTVLDIVDVQMPNQPPLDGVSLLPLFDGGSLERARPLGFMLRQGRKKGALADCDFVADTQGVWIDGQYKLIVTPGDQAATVALFDIYADPAHKTNLADQHPEIVQRLQPALNIWRQSVRQSFDGQDYVAKEKSP